MSTRLALPCRRRSLACPLGFTTQYGAALLKRSVISSRAQHTMHRLNHALGLQLPGCPLRTHNGCRRAMAFQFLVSRACASW